MKKLPNDNFLSRILNTLLFGVCFGAVLWLMNRFDILGSTDDSLQSIVIRAACAAIAWFVYLTIMAKRNRNGKKS